MRGGAQPPSSCWLLLRAGLGLARRLHHLPPTPASHSSKGPSPAESICGATRHAFCHGARHSHGIIGVTPGGGGPWRNLTAPLVARAMHPHLPYGAVMPKISAKNVGAADTIMPQHRTRWTWSTTAGSGGSSIVAVGGAPGGDGVGVCLHTRSHVTLPAGAVCVCELLALSRSLLVNCCLCACRGPRLMTLGGVSERSRVELFTDGLGRYTRL